MPFNQLLTNPIPIGSMCPSNPARTLKHSWFRANGQSGFNVPMPFANILRDRFLNMAAHGCEHFDWSAIGSLAAKDAALI
jgi:hypothetical protein